MLVDFHTHIFPDELAKKTIPKLEMNCRSKANTDGTEAGILESMENAGVTTSVILPVVTSPAQFETVNRFACEINEKYESKEGLGKLISFGGIHPDCGDYKECLRKIASWGMKGIKLHPDYQGVFIDDIRYMRIIEYASELGLIVSVHAGLDVGIPNPIHCPPERSRKVIDEIHPQKLVLAHLGGMAQWNAVEQYLVGQNVYFDTAYMIPIIDKTQFNRIISNHGVDKILFATDSPWQEQRKCEEIFSQMNFTKEELEQMCYKNAQKLLMGK